MTQPPSRTKFYLDKRNGKVMGVCAGIADYTGLDVTLVRIMFVSAMLMSGFSVLPLYFVAGFMAAAEAAPDELSAIVNVMQAPPMPFLPEERHGDLVAMAMMAFAGPEDEAQQVLAPFRALAGAWAATHYHSAVQTGPPLRLVAA